MIRRLVPAAVLLGLTLAWAPRASATQPGAGAAGGDGGSWGEEAGFVAGTAALGGLVGGVSALLRGRSSVAGFVGGSLGGGIAYGAKRLLQTDFLKTAFGSPAEDWIERRSTLARVPLARFVQPGVGFALLHFPLSGFRVTSPSSVLEREAGFLDSR